MILQAWKSMGDNSPKLIMCGIGPLKKWCEKYIMENKLENVELRGFVENSVVRQLIAGATALILPTQVYEGFPMTIVEAFSVGTPVVGSNIGNVGSLVDDGIDGIKFEYNSADSLCSAIERFEESNIVKMRENAYKKYVNKFDEKSNYQILMSVYSKISGEIC